MSSEGEDDRIVDSEEETAPFPHALTKSGQASTSPSSTHNSSHLLDGFPELDSELLQVMDMHNNLW